MKKTPAKKAPAKKSATKVAKKAAPKKAAPAKKPAAGAKAKPAPPATEKKESAGTSAPKEAVAPVEDKIGTVEKFDKLPPVAVSRAKESNYNFRGLTEPNTVLKVAVPQKPGETLEQRKKEAENVRGNVFAAFYRYMTSNPEAKNWGRAIRVIKDENDWPIQVGFYRQEDKDPSAPAKKKAKAEAK